MQTINEFSLTKHTGPHDSWPRKTDLHYQGKPIGLAVEGYVIEKQFKTETGYLLILSYDCPFEEANNFVLLDEKYRLVDSRCLGRMYASYLLQSAKPVNTGELLLKYKYEKDEYWLLRIEERRFGLLKKRLRMKRVKDNDEMIDEVSGPKELPL